jgi:photosystem II stability/assembly factor-like uncharacterized protein
VYSSSGLNDFHFANENTGWLGGQNGSIGKTTNGGINWTFQTLQGHASDYITAINFLNINTGWVVTNCCGGINSYAYLFKTTNSGVNWEQVGTEAIGVSTNSIAPLNKDTIFFSMGIANDGNNYGAVKKTINGGINFTSFTDGVNMFNKCAFVNNNTGWCMTSKKLFKTTNTGLSWELQTISGINIIRTTDFYFIDANTGYLSVYNGSVYFLLKTTNGGTNWDNVNLNGTIPYVYDMHFINANTGWVAGSNAAFAKTTSGGLSWTPFTVNSLNTGTRKIQFIDSLNGYVLGSSGFPSYLFKTTNGGVVTGFTLTSSQLPDNFSLSQNYPNPFNPQTRINYELPIASYVSIKVYDALGNEVQTLVNEKQNAGSFWVDFNAGSLPSGIYFYKLVTEKFSETKKMILIK